MNRKLFSAVLVFVLALLSGAALGAKTFPLTSSQAVPAAAGKVEVKKDKNGNNEVTIKTEHLAQTHFANFDVSVTAEGDPMTKIPSGQVVLSAKVQQ